MPFGFYVLRYTFYVFLPSPLPISLSSVIQEETI